MSVPGTDAPFADFFEQLDVPDAEIDAIEARFAPVTDELRRLIDLTIRSEVGDREAAAVLEHLRAASVLLEGATRDGPAGIGHNTTGRAWQWGNAVVGQRNAIAPPLVVERHDDGTTSARVMLGTQYEGPPSMVHGGVSALLLDHLMGVTASSMTKLTMTGTLMLRYRRPLPLGEVWLAGRIISDTGRKVVVTAEIGAADGAAVEAEGLFIVPSWSLG